MLIFRKLLPYLVLVIYRCLQWTWRIQIIESKEVQALIDQDKSFVLAHWHGDELGIFHLLRRYRVACMISTSKDGALMNTMAKLYGAQTVRGSSTRGGTQALKGILRLAKQGYRPSSAVDGPKGPIYQVKPGVFQISRLSKLPIVPLSFYCDRSYIFTKSWNQAELPKPFSRLTVYLGDTLPVVSRELDSRDPELAAGLKSLLHQTKEDAKRLAQGKNL